ncbi:hypothetical protein Poli38472_012159 [Pythium oligandrum]|uniref:Cyclic nucleotide-binding domain-containing protein n=1 Tax=Pythium oligandrum TaxID=41045 RepID=A0A8K1CRK6_PYTOL|nr:hypothetical protein Poli38472_012159 [Pythium oligandrum]|eukprot:TMW67043.1 hypothetical protein Poli38472_012159 [Pythium oligandrum]
MACCWHWITGEDQNAPNAVAPGAPTSEQYLSDFYYCTLLLQGQGDSSGTTPMQNLFSTLAVVLGSLILAIVFGNVGMLVSNFNANSTNYQRKMETVFATMNKLQLPHDMRERISLHYEHLWEEYEPLDGDIVRFPQLTHTLALEVGLYRYMNLILKMSYWRECSPDFVTQIVLKLVARVYLPDDYVLRQGEVGDEMYMVNRGLCEFAEDEKTEDDSIGLSTKGSGCESSDNSAPALHVRRAYSNETLPSSSGIEASDEAGAVHPVPSLKPVVGTSIASGESFGGMALLMNYPSKTGVRAVTYIEMCVLERTKFQQLLARYPDDRRRVLRSMLAACVDKRDIPFTRKEIDQMMARKRQKPMDDSDHHSRLRGTHLHKTEDDGTDGDVGIILIEEATPPPTAETDPGCDIESGCAERTNAPRHAKKATRQIEDDEDTEDDILATHLEIEDDVTGDTAHAVVLEDQKTGESTVLLEDEETGDVVVIDGSSRHHKQKRAVAAGGRRSKH